MQNPITTLQNLLAADGPLASLWPGFQARPAQTELARQVANAVQSRRSVILEAPTGSGKTLAYLLPVLLSHRRVIVSVGNLTLQDHLLQGEYQKLRLALPQLRSMFVLKGCDNYFCALRWSELQSDMGDRRLDPALQTALPVVRDWLRETRDGDIQSLPLAAPLLAQVRPLVTVGSEQCRGADCARFHSCFFQRARQRAATAEVLLINHRLLLSDRRLHSRGLGALLPGAEAVIVDEAHQLPDLLMHHNLDVMEEYRVLRWVRALGQLIQPQAGMYPEFLPLLRQLQRLWGHIGAQLQSNAASQRLIRVDGASLAPLANLLQRLQQWLALLHAAALPVNKYAELLQQWSELLQRAGQPGQVLYADLGPQGLRLLSPQVLNPFSSLSQDATAWVFLSATLRVAGSFDFFRRALSLPVLPEWHHNSGLDHRDKALLWLPDELPAPGAEGFYQAWLARLQPILRQLDGGILLLFSSHQALQQCAALLTDTTGRPLLVQTPQSDRQRLLRQFRQSPQSILLATGSFWEGIDVQGTALRCVAIDKLPFVAPDDPLALAWRRQAAEQGGSWFNDYMVPQAVIRLRQGVGRLLRGPGDQGLVVIGDRRLVDKPYGQRFLDSLPVMPRAQQWAEVADFLRQRDLLRATPGL